METVFANFPEPNNPFILFGQVHVWTIVYLVTVATAVLWVGKKGTEKSRRYLRKGMALIFLFWEIEWQVWHLWHGIWSSDINLPLHLCSIMIWVSMYGLWFEDRRVYGLMYFFGIAGAIQAIITPNATEAFPHIRYLSTMFTHSLLVICGLWVVLVEKYRPTLKLAVQAFLGLNAYALVVYFINRMIGSNYLYVVAKPSVATAIDYFPYWPGYILVLEGLLVLIMLGMMLPFWRPWKGRAPRISQP